MIVNHQVRVIRFFRKSLVGSQLKWSTREKECYGIYYDVKLFDDLLDNRYFVLKVFRTKYLLSNRSSNNFSRSYESHLH